VCPANRDIPRREHSWLFAGRLVLWCFELDEVSID
jgi:hypothetical protein